MSAAFQATRWGPSSWTGLQVPFQLMVPTPTKTYESRHIIADKDINMSPLPLVSSEQTDVGWVRSGTATCGAWGRTCIADTSVGAVGSVLQCGLRLKVGLPLQIQFFTLPWKCLLFSLNLFGRFNFSSNIGSFVQDRQKGWRSKIRLLSFELLLTSGIVLKPTRRTSGETLSSSWIFLLETQGGKVVGWGSCWDGWSLQSWDLVD